MWRYFLVASFLGLASFIVLAVFASQHPYFPGDLWTSHRLQDLHFPALERAMEVSSPLAEFPWGVIVLAATVGWLGWRGLRAQALLLLCGQLIRPLNLIVKEVVGRPRPSPLLVEVREFSGTDAFPSGHVVTALALFGLLFLWAGEAVPGRTWSWALRALCLCVISLTALERIHSGAHWLSDVYGAFLLGAAWLGAIMALKGWWLAGRRGK